MLKLSLLLITKFLFIAMTINLPYEPDVPIRCSPTTSCPKEWPCCSQYWTCGSGPICITGCNPKYSFSQKSCLPHSAFLPPKIMNSMQLLKDNKKDKPDEKETPKKNSNSPKTWKFDFTNLNIDKDKVIGDQQPFIRVASVEETALVHETNILPWTKYLLTGDNEVARAQWDSVDFTYSGTLRYKPELGELQLAMPKRSVGSLLTTSKSFLYGKAAVKIKAARSRGVITSMVLFSAVHDEIDFEFLGGDLMQAQTNYYYQGELDHTRMQQISVSSNINENYHVYEIDWNEERIIWLIDGQIVRTLFKADTWDPVSKTFKYPQTPMTLNISIWPGGNENNAPGTISWAGGLIDWENSPDILERGEFFCCVKEAIIEPFETEHIKNLKNKISQISPGNPQDMRVFFDFEPSNERHGFNNENVALNVGPIPHLSGFRSNGMNR